MNKVLGVILLTTAVGVGAYLIYRSVNSGAVQEATPEAKFGRKIKFVTDAATN